MKIEHSDFFSMTVTDLTAEQVDEISYWAFENGALGVEETLDFEQSNREYEPVTLSRDKTSIKIYFEVLPDQEVLKNIKLQYPESRFEVLGELNRDWLAEWRKDYKPFLLCGRVWVVPSWCERPPEAEQIIRIDPEMAFGTGTHETTRLAAQFLYDFSYQVEKSALSQRSLVDIGTGTGILAMIAELMGFGQIVGNDIDPESRRVARENLEKNNMPRTRIVDEDLKQIDGQFDFVVANIIDGVLVKLQADLKSRVKKNGYLLLTGILCERDELFRSEFSFEGFQVIGRRTLGEWAGYLLQKN